MAIVSTASLTISDTTDAKQLILYLNPTVKTQIYNPNQTGNSAYTPDFTSQNLVITPELYVAGGGTTNLLPSTSIKLCKWYEGSQTITAIPDGNSTGQDTISQYTIPTGDIKTTLKTLTLKTNLTNKTSQKFTCVVTYNDVDTGYDITIKADIEIVKVSSGLKGMDGSGADAVLGILSNENSSIPADALGVSSSQSMSFATSTLSIFEGSQEITDTYTIQLVLSPNDTNLFDVSKSGTPTNRTITVSKMDASISSANVTFRAEREGYPTITKTFTVTKINEGADGEGGNDATIYWLSMPNTLGKSDTNVYVSNTISIKAFSKTGIESAQEFNGYIQIDTSTDGTTFNTTVVPNTTQLTSGSYSYPASGSIPTNIKAIRVRLYASPSGITLLDEETCYILSDGRDAYFCNVWTPQGDTVRNSSGTLSITADLYKGGALVNPTAYKWYAQDPTVTVETFGGGGDSDGKAGWKLLQSVTNPNTQPTLTAVTHAGETLTDTTYFVKYTWVTTHGETLASPERSLAVGAGRNLTISVPTFPTGVGKAKIYVGTATGVVKLQGEITTSGSTLIISQPIVTNTALPPTTHTASYTQNVSNITTGTITVPASAITNIEVFKAVVSYGLNKYSGVTVVKDVSDPILTRVDGVTVFKNGDGEVTLRATLLQGGAEIDALNNSGYTYTWSIYKQNGDKTSFSKTGKTVAVNATDISGIGSILCEVSTS